MFKKSKLKKVILFDYINNNQMKKSYEFRDIFIKSCDYTNGEGNCTKTREAEKCINGKCEKVSSPAESKKEVMTDHYNQIKYDDSDSEYNSIFDKYGGFTRDELARKRSAPQRQSGGGEEKDQSVTLDINNFKKMISQNDVLVKFYAPWCMHCIHLVPEWNKLYNQNKTNVIIANFDGTKQLPKEVSIEGFPTIILFKNGKQIPYEGERTADNILEFLNKNADVQSGGDRTGRRYWVKDGKKVNYNPGYQKSKLSDSSINSDSDSDVSGDTSYSDENENQNLYESHLKKFNYEKHGPLWKYKENLKSKYPTKSDKPKLVLKPKISPKKDEVNRILLHNKKLLHKCNDHNCQSYGKVIIDETMDEHNQKHIERQKRHNEGDFSPLGLTRTETNYGGYNDDPKLKDALNHLDNLMKNLNVKHGGCDCEQTGGYNGDPKLKKRLIENLVKKYKGICKHCGKSKNPINEPPKKRIKYECRGKCQRGGCGPLCLAPLIMLGGTKRRKSKLRLIKIVKSTKHDKKLMAVFEKNGREKTVHFGAKNYSDYTHHRDPERKQRYLDRHRKNENWNDPTSAGALSALILWNKPTLRASIADYKRKFRFN